MPVTYTETINRPQITGGKLVEFWVDSQQRRGMLRFVHTTATGAVVKEDTFRFGHRSEDTHTFQQLIDALPLVLTLQTDGESALIAAGLIPAGAVE